MSLCQAVSVVNSGVSLSVKRLATRLPLLREDAAGNTRHGEEILLGCGKEVSRISRAVRKRALEAAGLVHPHPEAVTATLFNGAEPFFLPLDKVQVKYEMLRAHVVGELSVTAAARTHGYSRAAFYLVLDAFEQHGMAGLLDDRRGRHGPVKLTPEIVAFLHTADPSLSGGDLAAEVERSFGVTLHRRTVERARRR